MDSEYFAELFLQQHNKINGRGVFLYLIHTAIGQVWVVQWEQTGLELITKLFYNDMDGAQRYFKKQCAAILNGRI